jgi:hypothetical protein
LPEKITVLNTGEILVETNAGGFRQEAGGVRALRRKDGRERREENR